jgi:hypothetical protein
MRILLSHSLLDDRDGAGNKEAVADPTEIALVLALQYAIDDEEDDADADDADAGKTES